MTSDPVFGCCLVKGISGDGGCLVERCIGEECMCLMSLSSLRRLWDFGSLGGVVSLGNVVHARSF